MTRWRRLLALTAAAGLATGAAWWCADWRDGGDPATWPRHQLSDFAADVGFAYRATLPSGAPDQANGDDRGRVYEDDHLLAGGAEHDTIRQQGGGHWSFWHGTLWFATSDGTDPRQNGRHYTAAWPDRRRAQVAAATWWLAAGLGTVAGLLWLQVLLRAVGVRIYAWRRLLAKLSLIPASLLLTWGVAELVLRIEYPFADTTWPGRFDPAYGFSFQPGGVMRQTNLYDYCCEQTANSLGFLDREVPLAKAPGQRRILVLGDSFVEAVQVQLAEKMHVVLEGLLRQRGLAVDTMALGYSGCGTANELALYEAIGRRYRPDLVVVPLISNDLANNSPLLEAVRNGWHPDHMPRLFFAASADGTIRRQAIDADWEKYRLPPGAPPPPRPLDDWLHWSRVWRWLDNSVAFVRQDVMTPVMASYAARVTWLREHTPYAPALAGWHLPDDLDPDNLSATVDPPPAFREAVRLSAHALAALRDAVAADGGRLIVLAEPHLGLPVAVGKTGRQALPRGWLELWEPICRDAGVTLVDLQPEFARRGAMDRSTFQRDHHWNATGHATAAAVLADWLLAHPEAFGKAR